MFPDQLNNLHKRAVKLIDNKANRALDDVQLLDMYGLDSLSKRRKNHHLALLYRLKDENEPLETHRPDVGLRNNKKIKFKVRTTKATKVLNSSYYRGVRLWDRLSEDTQKARTKVKFKQMIK